MNRTFFIRTILVALFTIVVVSGCRTNPILEYQDNPITTMTNKELTLDQVKEGIVGAGVPLGWIFSDKEPGHLVGTLALRKHLAVIDIKYNTKTYSITYKDSENLNYDGTNIHAQYNNWILNLQRRINVKLNSM
jgi:hypothetical protein